MVDFKPTPAARRAGYSESATKTACRLLEVPGIRDEIVRRCTFIQMKLSIEADDVRRGIAAIATDPRPAAEGGPPWATRLAAWIELGRLLGLYTSKLEVRGSLTLEQLLLAADKAVEQPKLPAPH